MKMSSIILLAILVGASSCAILEKQESAKERPSTSVQPKPLEDDWCKWLVGDWEIVSGESSWLADEPGKVARIDIDEQGAGDLTIEFGLNGQFLIMRGQGDTGELTDEQKQQLRKTTRASDEEFERMLSMPYKSLQIQTIDPNTGDIVGYLFDSMRCVATGKGKREGNKETMKWKWSVTAQGATSTTITERISDNKFTVNHKYILPDGRKMEDKAEMVRCRTGDNDIK